MSELRQDPTTRNWVIIAPERGRRPHDGSDAGGSPRLGRCPFCPGNESMTPPELWRLPSGDEGWRVRVVPNRFPVLTPADQAKRRSQRGSLAMGGHGNHEVVIESPRHDWDLATGELAEVRDVVHAYRTRYRALCTADDVAVIVVFRNHGQGSGTSLDHPHSQIVAAPVVPPFVRQRFDVTRRHFDDYGTCLYVEIVERELAEGRRVVLTEGSVVAFQPFAATAIFETWVMPRFHQASFAEADDQLLDELAVVLRAVLRGLRRVLDDPPYNLVIHSAPPGEVGIGYFSWHLQIVPRVSTPAGFELATGIPVNPSLPEETAAGLREAVAAPE
jgi:UDPglucose--hexose-1-phosphate uridylyltransferase